MEDNNAFTYWLNLEKTGSLSGVSTSKGKAVNKRVKITSLESVRSGFKSKLCLKSESNLAKLLELRKLQFSQLQEKTKNKFWEYSY